MHLQEGCPCIRSYLHLPSDWTSRTRSLQPVLGCITTKQVRDKRLTLFPNPQGGEIVGIEVKSTSRVSSRDFRHLEVLKSEINEKFKCGIVIHPGKNAVPFGDQLYALPLASLWQRILTQKEGQIKPATKLNEVPPSVIDRPIEFPPGSFSGLTL